MNQQQSEETINRVLSSLDAVQRAEAPPYLFTRVMARMNQPAYSSWDPLVQWTARPAVAFAIAAGCILLNAAVYITTETATETTVANDNTLEEELTSSVTTTLYDY
jgi:hypothetical protein